MVGAVFVGFTVLDNVDCSVTAPLDLVNVTSMGKVAGV